jgi:DNA-binding NarL/FixJ family response regulator
MGQLRIFLADDHTMVRTGLRALINAEPDMHVVGEASDGGEALAGVIEAQPDLVVIDIVMPRLGGLEAIPHLLARTSRSRVLVLSVHEEASYPRQAIEAGASGYVLKRSAATVLIEAIHAIMAHHLYLDPALGKTVITELMRHHSSLTLPLPPLLSEREAVVLRLIAQGYSNKEIAFQLDLSVKTVETYKARALEKLGIGSRVEIVRYALDHGWLNEQQ